MAQRAQETQSVRWSRNVTKFMEPEASWRHATAFYPDPDTFSLPPHMSPRDVVVSVLATGPKGCGLKPGQGDGFLRTIKIHGTPSFGWEVKPEVPCRKILWHVKEVSKSHGDG
jgi:hypothetical protein